MQHSSSDQSLYGVWRYELTQEECEITLPVLISVNKKTTDDDEIDASNGALVMWDAESEKPKYEVHHMKLTLQLYRRQTRRRFYYQKKK